MTGQNALLVTYRVNATWVTGFRGAGFQVYECDSDVALLQQSERHHPDAVLLNIADLAHAAVVKLMSALRQLRGGEFMPVLMTGRFDDAAIQAAFDAGADDYLPAEFPPAHAIQRTDWLLRQSNRESSLRMTLALVERAKQEWEVAVDSLSELICVLGHDGRVIRTNRTLEAWGIGQVQEVRGRTLSSLIKNRFPMLAEAVEGSLYASWVKIMDGVPLETEVYESSVDQSFSIQIRPLAHQSQYRSLADESAAVAIFENITARKTAEQALTEYAAELEQRNQELDAYGHTVAHDLKSPLNLILGYADMLAIYTPEELVANAPTSLQRIIDSALRMAEMIDQLLLLAATRDAIEQTTTIDVEPLVMLALDRFEHEIAERGIAVEVGHALPKAVGHSPWVVEIFANLIGNAIKYLGLQNPNPSIRILGQRDGGYSRFEVHDTGVGIEPSDQERLFRMFSRLHPNMAEGTGLGLSIVHRMVTRQNGMVGVESIPGIGSTFWFTLPHPL